MFVIGSRGSDLALAQSRWVQKRILQLFPGTNVSIRIIKTTGDKDTVSSIRTGQSIGVFVKELERALLDAEIDLAVHSMKDLPTKIPSDLTIAAIPCREDVRDAFITKNGSGFRDLPSGSRIGTGSLRRQAQLLALRPDLQIKDIRGNVNTRFKKLEEQSYDALVLACAGLNRLEFQNRITEKFTLDQILPAPGQGALAIQTRADDDRTLQIAHALNHNATSVEVRSERVFLQRVGGGCNIPVAVYSRMEQDRIHITGLIISPDGRKNLRDSIEDIPESADEAAALLADRILNNGGRDILEAL
jgi:hydroxymethylbilane synthase